MSVARSYENYANTWWTTGPWIEWVTETLGAWWFDPCPKDWKEGDPCGTEIPWMSRNYCNRPGGRGSIEKWWPKTVQEVSLGNDVVWCSFGAETPRQTYPSMYGVPGWMIMPRRRIEFIWGGPDIKLKSGIVRRHGDLGTSPANWTSFWSSVKPAKPPEECVIIRTGEICTY